ncbi:flagellar motor switch protein [Pragia fontium]|nr:flagellar motor switch protein [Pragia fontium]
MKLEVNKLGRPYHKVPKIFTNNFDILDAKISTYFLKKYRVNVALDDITFHMDSEHKYAQIFSTPFGNIAFDIDRMLLLNILNDYYGLGKDNVQIHPDLQTPITKTEERLKNKLGLELSSLVLHPGIFGDELEIKNDYSTIINKWSYKITFSLEGYDQGQFHILLDNQHVDRLLATLRRPNEQDRKESENLSNEQLERMINCLPVRLVGRLSCSQLTVAELMTLTAGDIIPVSLPNRFPLLIGKEQLFNAVIAEDRGKLYFSEFNDNSNETKHD